MTRMAYVNGDFVPLSEARVSVLDRGFLFADGIYEVTAVIDGRLVDFAAHLSRLHRSLAEIDLPLPVPAEALEELHLQLIARNALTEGLVYLQITRGAPPERDFAFPADTPPTLVLFTQAKVILDSPLARTGVKVVSVPDLRWKRRDIKSIALLAQVLAKQQAARQGAFEAWMVEEGVVTEGSSSSAYIVREGRLVTRQLSNAILPGCTRLRVLEMVRAAGLTLDERPFTLEEAYGAEEAFLTSASAFVMPVVEIDGYPIGSGAPGPQTLALREAYIEQMTAGQS